MADRDHFIAELRRCHDGVSWHGPSLATLLEDLDPAVAADHPARGLPSIWEIVLHVAAWAGEVARRLRGATPGLPLEGDWPPAPHRAGPKAWSLARARLAMAQADLIAAVHALPTARFDEFAPAGEDGLIPGGALRDLIHGALRHESHHAGQVSVLKGLTVRRTPVRTGRGKQA